METTTLTVPNIGCDGCVRTIQNELSELNGVQRVHGDVASKQVTIAWDAPADLPQIRAKLVEIEYPASE